MFGIAGDFGIHDLVVWIAAAILFFAGIFCLFLGKSTKGLSLSSMDEEEDKR